MKKVKFEHSKVDQIDGDFEIIDIVDENGNPREFTEEEKASFELSMASTIDIATKKFPLTYKYLNQQHFLATRKLIHSIMDYITDDIPIQSNMTKEQFFDYIIDFYKNKIDDVKKQTKDESEITIHMTQLIYGEENVVEFVKQILLIIENPENDRTNLKLVCELMNINHQKQENDKRQIFRNMASALMEPEKTPGW